MNIDAALQKLQKMISKVRFDHTVRVLNTARELATHYNTNEESVQLAVIFHDYAKEIADDILKQYIIKHQLDDRLLSFHKELWHGPVAAHIVQQKYGIKNKSVLNAIYYHTTGRANMDMVELIVFVADYIEPNRSFPGLNDVREHAFINIHKAALMKLKNTILYLIKQNALIFPDTFYAYNDLTTLVTGGNK